jgi:hypothetical protein
VGEPRMSPESACSLLAALAAVNAARAGLDGEIPVPGSQESFEAFLGVVALAAEALDEVARLGGSPEALLRRVYVQAALAA